MDYSDRRYDEGDVAAIVKRALSMRGTHDTISHEDLVEIARHTGLTREQLEDAIDLEAREGDMDRARAVWTARRRAKFNRHLRSYVIVIGALLLMNLMTRGAPWVLWPMIGWGIGLAFDASDTFFASAERIDRGARRILKRGKVKKFWNDVIEDVITDV